MLVRELRRPPCLRPEILLSQFGPSSSAALRRLRALVEDDLVVVA